MKDTSKHSFRENIISQVNYKQIAYTRELIYEELCKHLKAQGLYLDHEMFRAILCCCNELTRRYTANPDVYREDTRQLFAVFFHNLNLEDYPHIIPKVLRDYVEDVFPHIIERINEEAAWGDASVRIKKVDVVRLGKLFDQILDGISKKEERENTEKLMKVFIADIVKK